MQSAFTVGFPTHALMEDVGDNQHGTNHGIVIPSELQPWMDKYVAKRSAAIQNATVLHEDLPNLELIGAGGADPAPRVVPHGLNEVARQAMVAVIGTWGTTGLPGFACGIGHVDAPCRAT